MAYSLKKLGAMMSIKLTQDDVIKQFEKVHGSKYDYSNVVWVRNNQKVEIICEVHGVFLQTPNNHKSGRGCNMCRRTSKQTEAEVISDFVAAHGDRYDYSLVEYLSSKLKVDIICKTHGVFKQEVGNHKAGKGCPRCGDILKARRYHDKPTLLYFIKLAGVYKIGITTQPLERRYSERADVVLLWSKTYNTGLSAYNQEQRILKAFSAYKYLGKLDIHGGESECFRIDISKLENFYPI